MQKTKLGISVGLLTAILYFSGMFSGLLLTCVIAGYILLKEEDEALKKNAVNAVVLTIAFSVIYTVIGLIPNAIDVLDNLLYIFGGGIKLYVIGNIISFIRSVVAFAETVIFLALGLSYLVGMNIKLPIADLIEKHIK